MRRLYQITIYSFFIVVLWGIQQDALGSIVILNGLTHESTALPGETYRAQIEVQNVAEVQKSVRIYIKDYWYNYKGESRHDEPGTLERSSGNWITLQSDLINLAPQERTFVNVEVKVPEGENVYGTFWSVVMVEGITPPDTSQSTGVSINTALRYAVQIITNIGNTGSSNLKFAGMNLAKDEKSSVVQVILENTGERLLRPEVSIELFDGNGASVGTITADPRKTLPGTSIIVNLVLEGIKPGTYSGVLVADCGGDNIFGTNVSFELI